jgi:hypothetical protein
MMSVEALRFFDLRMAARAPAAEAVQQQRPASDASHMPVST